ncbi:hypothetical protein NP493_2190g00018 [Ridgeia piscesae]|uniref:Uncharacterized protein n=1 Tax=Ridgeia piscesae TaxID=27915 RepID=A0AAD9JK42_RIDPI|nr:hypothetical protein NP493_2190g00018 [Ridgeia piscesae]
MGTHHPSKAQASSRANKDGKEYVKHHIPGQENKHLGKRKDKHDVTEQVRRRKWTWAGHVGRIRDDRWTLSINIWKPRRWRDELVDYWKGTIWLRIAQGTQMWKQHAEVSAQSRDTLAAQ